MKEFRGTPGEWQAIHYEFIGWSVENEDRKVIADIEYPPGTAEAWEANARIISASKDLLEALQRRVDNAEQRVFEDWLTRTRPSGDASSVHWQWEQSYDFLDFLEEWEVEIAAIRKALGE